MRNYFIYGGKKSTDFGVYISGSGTFSSPEKEYEVQEVPGRNGDLYFDLHRFKNITVDYPAFIVRDIESSLSALRSYLLSFSGYQRLEDTYHLEEFRMAVYMAPIEPEMSERLTEGKFTLAFNCKPQRFLKSGEKSVTLESSGKIMNPTNFSSRPLVRIYGTGTLTIGSISVKVKENPYQYIDLDSDTMDARYMASSCNQYIEISGIEFPVLNPGTNGVTLGSGITKLEITPRWWKL